MEKKYTEINKISFLDNSIKTWKTITLLVIGAFLFQGFFVYIAYAKAVEKAIDRVYIARDFGLERVYDKKAMAKGHVINFYKLFFEIDAGNYKKNIAASLELVGESGKELANLYNNQKYYERIVTNNLSIGVDIDSIKLSNQVPPYFVEVFAKRVVRSTYGNKYAYLNSTMEVRIVSNTDQNPFGMMIENFKIIKGEDVLLKTNEN